MSAGIGSCEGEKSSAHHEARERSYGDREWGAWQSAAQHRVTVWAQTNASGEVPAVFELTPHLRRNSKAFEVVRGPPADLAGASLLPARPHCAGGRGSADGAGGYGTRGSVTNGVREER